MDLSPDVVGGIVGDVPKTSFANFINFVKYAKGMNEIEGEGKFGVREGPLQNLKNTFNSNNAHGVTHNFEHLVGPYYRYHNGKEWVRIGLVPITTNQLGGGVGIHTFELWDANVGGFMPMPQQYFEGGNHMNVIQNPGQWPVNNYQPPPPPQPKPKKKKKKNKKKKVESNNNNNNENNNNAQTSTIVEEEELDEHGGSNKASSSGSGGGGGTAGNSALRYIMIRSLAVFL